MRRTLPVFAVLCALTYAGPAFADWPADQLGPLAVWDAAYDAKTGTRFVPTQLTIPAMWSGARKLDLPAAGFAQPGGTRWHGPMSWRDPVSGAARSVYDRSRENRREGAVAQKIALAEAGLGRVYDSR